MMYSERSTGFNRDSFGKYWTTQVNIVCETCQNELNLLTEMKLVIKCPSRLLGFLSPVLQQWT